MIVTVVCWYNVVASKIDCMSTGNLEVGTLIFRDCNVKRLLVVL